MQNLIDYVTQYAERGACQCGKCIDAPASPETKQPTGHTADLIFFKVAAKPGADAAVLWKLVEENRTGAFTDVNLLDGKDHNFMEVGAWIGDQGLALMLMGLGSVLGLWKLRTPRTILGPHVNEAMVKQMAEGGWVTIQHVDE